jgi:hypothetical protein
MRKTLLALAVSGVTLGAFAKLPPPDDAAKAKAAEAAAKAAWQSKVDAYQLCKSQDKIAAKYGKHTGNQATKAMPAVKPVVSASAAASAAASAPATTPAVASAPPPCADPGPFAYNPPEQKPLETSGAHSPSGTAASPPSNRPEAATTTPKK